jgi:hypothetical protein
MLRALPFQTIGDIARHGLELRVYCPTCYSTRQPANLDRWADRCFATVRFQLCACPHLSGAAPMSSIVALQRRLSRRSAPLYLVLLRLQKGLTVTI